MAGESPGYISTMVKYYDDYGSQLSQRCESALRGIKDGGYEPKQFLSDVLYIWSFGLIGLVPFGPAYLARKKLFDTDSDRRDQAGS